MPPAPPEQPLHDLTQEQAGNWVTVGRLLFELEAHSRSDSSGKPWQDALRETLTKLGTPISTGHLYKVRRAYAFLHEHAQTDVKWAIAQPPKISSVEVAERLYRVDAQEGLKALADALRPDPIPYVDLKKRYDEALKTRPEMKSPRQVAWETRRKASSTPKASEENATGAIEQREEALSEPDETSGPSATLQKKASTLLGQAWKAGWDAATEHYEPELDELRETVRDQQEEIAVLVEKVHDLRGYLHDF
jgi:hypothetical protein